MNDFSFQEQLAETDENMLEKYLNEDPFTQSDIQKLIAERKVFPCYFGSALKMEGIREFIEALDFCTINKNYADVFGAKVFKISRDKTGNRLSHMKITSGILKVKDLINDEKVDQIRIYSGDSFMPINEAVAGCICTVSGLQNTFVGQSLGMNDSKHQPSLIPVLKYALYLPNDCDSYQCYHKLKILEEEIPELLIDWDKQTNEITVHVMGEVQVEVLKHVIKERFDLEVSFGSGSIVYKETIKDSVHGSGHYEPLRHYAEVRLLLKPLEQGAGICFSSNVSEDILDRNWQRLILTHLKEKTHKGVLTGSEITDIEIVLTNGRAHKKHTEGGDFRQATYRAVRHGLKNAKSMLLEPFYEFILDVPTENIGRAMADIQMMHGTFDLPVTNGENTTIRGTCPVATMQNYQLEVAAYTKGYGTLFYRMSGYYPCHNESEIIASIGYDSEKDSENPTGSVFCDHGAGFYVPWDKVDEYMHTEKRFDTNHSEKEMEIHIVPEEIDAIIARTFYANKKSDRQRPRTVMSPVVLEQKKPKLQKQLPEILLVDGYNIIYSWEELKNLAETNLDGARGKLMDILCNYQGFRKNIIILVFDGYKVVGNPGEVLKYHNIYVVYTKEAETADQYIEKTVHDISSHYHVRVATSDKMEQMIIMGHGAHRLSAADLHEEIMQVGLELKEKHIEQNRGSGNYLFDALTEELADIMDDVRMGRRTFQESKNDEEGANNDNV